MPIDPARLARIRSRLLAAAALTAAGCAGGPEHVNSPPPEHTFNEPPIDQTPTPEPSATATPPTGENGPTVNPPPPDDGPHVNTPPPEPPPRPDHVNTPAPNR